MHCYEQVGSTILNGALSTMVAAICLVLCQFGYLKKMGVMMIVTIVASLFSSLILYPAILLCMGPEGDHGKIDLKKMIKRS